MQNLVGLSWGSMLFRGIVALLFGITLLVYPGLTLATLVLFFAGFAAISGLFAVIGALVQRNVDPDWILHFIEGLIGIVIGVLVWTWPGISSMVLLYTIAFRSMLSGLMQLVAAIKLRRVVPNEFWLVISALLSIVFGLIVFRFPGAGAVGIAWVIGFYAILFGLIMIMLAFKLKKVK